MFGFESGFGFVQHGVLEGEVRDMGYDLVDICLSIYLSCDFTEGKRRGLFNDDLLGGFEKSIRDFVINGISDFSSFTGGGWIIHIR